MMFCNMVLGLFAFIAATVLLVWVYGRQPQCGLIIGKVFAWIALVLASVVLVVQFSVCTNMCMGGKCPRMMGESAPSRMMQMERGRMGKMRDFQAMPTAPSNEENEAPAK